MIKHKLLDDGAFVAGDTITGRTAYAYPHSGLAYQGAYSPAETAEAMMVCENDHDCWRDRYTDYDARNWERLES